MMSPRSGYQASQSAAPEGTDRAFFSDRRSGSREFDPDWRTDTLDAVQHQWPGNAGDMRIGGSRILWLGRRGRTDEASNLITVIEVDREGKVWAGTSDGLCQFIN